MERTLYYLFAAVMLVSSSCVCVQDFEDTQVICRAYPSQYALWQYAPQSDVTSQLIYVKNCEEASGFAATFAAQWELFNVDTTVFCVECQALGDVCPRYTTCP